MSSHCRYRTVTVYRIRLGTQYLMYVIPSWILFNCLWFSDFHDSLFMLFSITSLTWNSKNNNVTQKNNNEYTFVRDLQWLLVNHINSGNEFCEITAHEKFYWFSFKHIQFIYEIIGDYMVADVIDSLHFNFKSCVYLEKFSVWVYYCWNSVLLNQYIA